MIHLNKEIRKLLSIKFWTHSSLESVENEKVLTSMHNEVIDFLTELSKKLNTHSEIRNYPDLATFAFFCRKSNINKLNKKTKESNFIQIGRGITFHIAPSNVPMNFAYSLIMGLLAGNINIVRIPSKKFKQVDVFIEVLNKFKDENVFIEVLKKIILIHYNREKIVTDYLSSICSNRVIWGGNNTISEIRKSILPARSYDITFSDRYSFSILGITEVLNYSNIDRLASDFYNDTYLFDQNACTAPHLIIWTGNKQKLKSAQELFWFALDKLLKQKNYSVQPATAVEKLTNAYLQAMSSENPIQIVSSDNDLWRIENTELKEQIVQFKTSCGYFNEYYTKDLNEILPIINESYQTLSYFGIKKETLMNLITENGIKGIDRIVPIGRTSDFSSIWDGYELINTLSRKLTFY